jgi:hypothetical protein
MDRSKNVTPKLQVVLRTDLAEYTEEKTLNL